MRYFQRALSKRIGLHSQDFFKGTRIREVLDFLKQSQSWSMDQIHAYQLQKLKQVVEHAFKHVPYYSRTFKEVGLSPSDIKSFSDIKRIPVLTKETARKENMNLLAEHVNLKKVKKTITGGTTGSPLIVFKDVEDRSYTWSSYYRWYEWMGIKPWDPVMTVWGSKTVTKKLFFLEFYTRTTSFIHNNHLINSFELTDRKKAEAYDQMMHLKPVLIKGYLSSLLDIADYMRQYQLLPPPSLKAVSSTTETLYPMYRKELKKIFNVPVFDQYGCGEVSGIAYECPRHEGLHVNQEHVYLEILDDEGNDVTGTSGRVVVTNFDNFAMPFLRYENGDCATALENLCSCGMKSSIIKSIDGRIADTLTLSTGAKVHGVFITDILYELGITVQQVHRTQARQKKAGEITLLLEVSEFLDNRWIDAINTQLNRFFHTITIQQTEKIPADSNGKFRYVISEI
jgi:phenylacetate-CoA ligase